MVNLRITGTKYCLSTMLRKHSPKVKVNPPLQKDRKQDDTPRRRSADVSKVILTNKRAHKMSVLEGEIKVSAKPCKELPLLKTMPIRRTTRQYRVGAAFTGLGFELIDGHRQFGVIVGTGASNVRSWVDLWRVARVRVYCHANDDDQHVRVDITPVGADNSDNFLNDLPQVWSVSSSNTSEYVLLDVEPTLDHPMGMWHTTSNVNPNGPLFLMTAASADQNTIMLIDFEYIENFSGITNGFVETSSVIALGQIGGWNLFSGNMITEAINRLG